MCPWIGELILLWIASLVLFSSMIPSIIEVPHILRNNSTLCRMTCSLFCVLIYMACHGLLCILSWRLFRQLNDECEETWLMEMIAYLYFCLYTGTLLPIVIIMYA